MVLAGTFTSIIHHISKISSKSPCLASMFHLKRRNKDLAYIRLKFILLYTILTTLLGLLLGFVL